MKADISPELLAHYQQETTTLATLWKITRRDTHVYAFTDHDRQIIFDGLTYVSTSSYDAGAVQTTSSMSVDNVSLTGLLAVDAVTAKDIEAGLWDAAAVEIVEVNYKDLTMGSNVLRYGQIGEIQRSGDVFTAELRGLMQKLQNIIGRIVSASCDADLGDARCKVDLESFRKSGTVTAVTSNREFTASAVAERSNWYAYGVVTFTSGLNDGLQMEVKTYAGGGVFELQLDMPNDIAIGDTFTAVPGCNKRGRGGQTTKSTTSLEIATGTQAFTTEAGLLFTTGERVVATSDSDITNATFMSGHVTSYSGSTLTLDVDAIGGTGTFADWSITGGVDGAGDCVTKFNNYINFRGFEDIPGQDKILLVGGQ